MIGVRAVRELTVSDRSGPWDDPGISHLSAASGLGRIGQRLYVVADDEHALGVFDLSDNRPGTLFPIFEGKLPLHHRARKAAKPDLESLVVLPSLPWIPNGALLALGSGSLPNRQRGVCVPLDAQGGPVGPARHIDLSGWFEPLHLNFPDLNIEGAFIDGADFCLLQRGNSHSPVNACLRFARHEVETWLQSGGPVPSLASARHFDLGLVNGVPLCFTDGAALPDGSWVFSAAAEATDDSVADGSCHGSVVGWVGATGQIQMLQPLSLRCKVEGIAATLDNGVLKLLLVTDADDRGTPALLLRTTLETA
jgi:hypothetical protein